MCNKEILEEIQKKFESTKGDCKCNKFTGALTVELIRDALLKKGFNVSERDVFIKGIPIEIDLVISKKGAKPKNRILYQPEDLLVVLEVKSKGTFGESSIKGILKISLLLNKKQKKFTVFMSPFLKEKPTNGKQRIIILNPAHTPFSGIQFIRVIWNLSLLVTGIN